ncbi:MAG: TIM barrel protein, partial [Anaerolineales bacterium]
KSAMIGSVEDVLQMALEVENVQPCIDFAHLHARPGDGSMNSVEEWERILEKLGNALGDGALKRLHIHLSGIAYSAKGEREHLPIQEADLNVQAIFRALKEFGCEGRILCESPILEEDALYLRQLWQELA